MSKNPESNGSWFPKSSAQSQPGGDQSFQTYFASTANSPPVVWENSTEYQAPSQNFYNSYGAPYNIKTNQQPHHSEVSGPPSWDWDASQINHQQFQQPMAYHHHQQQQQQPQQQQQQQQQQPHPNHHHQHQHHQQQQHHHQQQQHQLQHQHHPGQHLQQHQQSHSFQNQQQHYQQYAGYSQDTNQDPWNWGWDDSSNYIEPQNNNRGNSSSPGNNNNNNPDHTWNWSVEGSSVYQGSLTQVDSIASSASALSLTSSFSDTSQSLGQVNNRSENTKNNASTYHAEQTPCTASITASDNSTGVSFSSVTHSLSNVEVKNAFVDTTVNNIEHNNVKCVTEKSDYARTDQFTNVHQGLLGTEKVTDLWRSEVPESVSSVDNHLKENISGQSNWTTEVGGKDHSSEAISSDVRNAEYSNRDDSVAVGSTQMQDHKEGRLQRNDLENVNAITESVKHTVCMNDVQQCDGSSSSNSANVQAADESIHNQRVEGITQPRDSSVPADTTDTGESCKDSANSMTEGKEHIAILAQDETKTLPVSETGRSNHFSEPSTEDNEQENVIASGLAEVNLEADENRIESDCLTPSGTVTNALDTSNVNCTQGHGDVENVEIVPPETDFQSRTVYGNVEGTVATVSQNLVSKTNPYSANKALNHKHANKYQSKQTVDVTTNRSYTLPTVSSEASGNTSSKADSKSLAIRTRRTVDDAEDTVNLETVPDNKERPDFVEMQQSVLERKSVSPMPRLHTVPVGQDAAVRPPTTWSHGQQPHGSYYGPENQEVAPVTGPRAPGPDRDQYLETGQLSEETPTPPPGLHRMIPGEGGAPPPGLRRMVPGECSSPDTSVPNASATEARVVTGVAHDDNLQLPVQSSGSRVASDTSSLVAEPVVSSGGLTQPPSERSETIGSDNVDSYSLQTTDSASRESSNLRREVSNKERERRVVDDQDVQDRDRRHEYYDSHNQSPGRYRDERDSRRSYEHDRSHDSEDRGHYRRRSREDERGGRHRGSYERSEDEADTEDCLSDRDRRERPVPREGYERYRRRGDRERNEREGQDKCNRERTDHRSSGRERERRRHDRDRTDFGRDEYYGRYYDEDLYKRENHRSRPTSRSGSRPDYDDYRRPDYHGYGYGYYGRPGLDPYHYEAYYSYKYYENLRRTNPAAYADWYAKYYGEQHQFQQGVYSEDRGSVHSGRSSENDDRYRTGQYHHHDYYRSSSFLSDYGARRPREQSEPSVLEGTASTTPQRLTPVKFMAAHVKGVWTTRGRMLKILPQCPLEGQPAVIEICDVSHMISDSDLEDYPGPLIRDVTHKNSLISFCSRKIKRAERDPNLYDRASVILLWRLLILLLRQNGTVVGADIAELLVSCTTSSSSSSTSSLAGTPVVPQQNVYEARTDEQINKKCEEEVTNQFREYLLYGNTKEALEWAMKHGLWGHALFLASKMDKRTHAQVMMRFANGLKMNDPLQTLYQLMSGRQPAAVTCCADEEWGDWKPHLAMILSNSTQRPELDHKAITTLGDTLGARGCLHAAHFCYLMAQLPFGIYSNKASKLVLIGSSHVKPFMEFATNEAIQMTEIYIYACQLANPNFELPQFEAYKLLYALRLAERGMVTEAIHYIEVLANTVMQSTIQYPLSFLKQIHDAGNLLKYCDPVYTSGVEDNTERDPVWLQELEKFILNYGVMYVNQEDNGSNMSSVEQFPPAYLPTAGTTEEMMQPVQESSHFAEGWQQEQYSVYQAQQNSTWAQEATSYENSLTGVEETTNLPEQAEYWNRPSEPTVQLDTQNVMTSQVPTQEVSNEWEPVTGNKEKTEPGSPASASAKAKLKVEPTKPVASSSWFGGLWNKLSLRPKNQMKLPDDKNPSIVWNPEKNRWTNLDADDDDAGSDVPPPPKTEMNRTPAPLTNVQEPQNKYKMSRGRSLRANYVDVLGSSKTPNQTIKSDLFPSLSSTQPSTTYFIPAPADENAPTDFLTSASSADAEADATQESSSVAATGSNYSIPPMYDPNSPNYPAAAMTSTTTAAAATAARILYPN